MYILRSITKYAYRSRISLFIFYLQKRLLSWFSKQHGEQVRRDKCYAELWLIERTKQLSVFSFEAAPIPLSVLKWVLNSLILEPRGFYSTISEFFLFLVFFVNFLFSLLGATDLELSATKLIFINRYICAYKPLKVCPTWIGCGGRIGGVSSAFVSVCDMLLMRANNNKPPKTVRAH